MKYTFTSNSYIFTSRSSYLCPWCEFLAVPEWEWNYVYLHAFPCLTMVAISFRHFDTLGMLAMQRRSFSLKRRFSFTPYSWIWLIRFLIWKIICQNMKTPNIFLPFLFWYHQNTHNLLRTHPQPSWMKLFSSIWTWFYEMHNYLRVFYLDRTVPSDIHSSKLIFIGFFSWIIPSIHWFILNSRIKSRFKYKLFVILRLGIR